ncbi:MAG TPA: septum formation protein Maf [Anaerolineae bacterium]|nr:septum formation protein Maf [Anaerolineae bacterium]
MLWEQVWLASNSPRRRELLNWTGLEYEVHPAQIDETPIKNEGPDEYVSRLARQKAIVIGETAPANTLVIAADTIVVYKGAILGKPTDDEHARQILMDLQGNSHQVKTAVAVYQQDQQKLYLDLCCSTVQMRDYLKEEVDAYIATGDPYDKAGAYAIQHKVFHPVVNFQGCYTCVMGLPLCHLERNLRKFDSYNYLLMSDICQKNLAYECPIFQRVLAGENIG